VVPPEMFGQGTKGRWRGPLEVPAAPGMYDNLSAVAIGRGPRRCLFECLKNILLDFKNGHNRFITSVGPYGAY
jgi:hypothetical protein